MIYQKHGRNIEKNVNINESLKVRAITSYEKEGLKSVENIPPSQIYFEKTFPKTAQKIKFSIKDFFGKCGQIRNLLRFPVK